MPGQFRKHAFGFPVDADKIRILLRDQLVFAFAVAHMPFQYKIFQMPLLPLGGDLLYGENICKTGDIKNLHNGFIDTDQFHTALDIHLLLRLEDHAQSRG